MPTLPPYYCKCEGPAQVACRLTSEVHLSNISLESTGDLILLMHESFCTLLLIDVLVAIFKVALTGMGLDDCYSFEFDWKGKRFQILFLGRYGIRPKSLTYIFFFVIIKYLHFDIQ